MVRALIKYPLYLGLLAIALILLDPLQLDTRPYTLNYPGIYEGGLASNSKLNQAQLLFKDKLLGPESLTFLKGEIYTGTADGRIMKFRPGSTTLKEVANIGVPCSLKPYNPACSRPLGIRADSKNQLWVADAFKGIYSLDPTTGKRTEHVYVGHKVAGRPILFPDDLALDEKKGLIYFSDASTRWRLNKVAISVLEHDCTGRVLQYSLATKEISVLTDGLCFPNGVELLPNKDLLLVAEMSEQRIVKIPLTGTERGRPQPLAEKLPGTVDNIRYVPSRGTVWAAIGLAGPKPSLSARFLAFCPPTSKLVGSLLTLTGQALEQLALWTAQPALLDTAHMLQSGVPLMHLLMPSQGLVVELDLSGRVLRSLHSPDGAVNSLSEVLETPDGKLYLGSYSNPFLAHLA